MKKLIFFAFLVLPIIAGAKDENVKFPINELGNCGSKAECKTYCDNPVNESACWSFAEKNDLMSKEEIDLARKMSSGEIKGPGGCTSEESCEAYCDNLSRIEECVSFAEAHNLIPADELEEIQRIRNAIKQGVKPPACNNKRDCDSYCQKPENMEVCINFALKAGLMEKDEQEEAEKILGAIQKGFKPPACGGKNECEAYCSREENFKECTDFAKAAGMMSEEEFEKISEGSKNFRESLAKAPEEVKDCIVKALGKDISQISPGPTSGPALRDCYEKYKPKGDEQYGPGDPGAQRQERRSGPGGCQSREECDAYCRSNPDECRPEGFERGAPPSGDERRGENREQFTPPKGEMMPPPNSERGSGETGTGSSDIPRGDVTPPQDNQVPSSEPSPEPAPQETAPASTEPPVADSIPPVSSLPLLLQSALVIFGIR